MRWLWYKHYRRICDECHACQRLKDWVVASSRTSGAQLGHTLLVGRMQSHTTSPTNSTAADSLTFTRCWWAVCNHTQQILQTAQRLIHWHSYTAGIVSYTQAHPLCMLCFVTAGTATSSPDKLITHSWTCLTSQTVLMSLGHNMSIWCIVSFSLRH